MFRKIFSRSKKPKEEEYGPAITRGCNLAMLQRKYPNLTTSEMCGNCGEEVVIPAYFASRCPECGERILPCSMCDWNDMPCDACPFGKNRKRSKAEPCSEYSINRSGNVVRRMSMNECLKYLDGEFYRVERSRGSNRIHVNGYFYESDDEGDGRYRYLEFSGAYLDPAEVRRNGGWDESEFNGSIRDLTEGELIEMISDSASGVVRLDMRMVTDSTPEGWYFSPVN